jgi:hypothetical protein
MKSIKFAFPIVLGLVCVVLALAMLGTPAEAASPSIATVLNTASAVTGTFYSRVVEWGDWTYADVFFRGTAATTNSTAVVLEVSPDQITWYEHSVSGALRTLAAAPGSYSAYNAAVAVHGRYFRLKVTTTNAGLNTYNVKAFLR